MLQLGKNKQGEPRQQHISTCIGTVNYAIVTIKINQRTNTGGKKLRTAIFYGLITWLWGQLQLHPRPLVLLYIHSSVST